MEIPFVRTGPDGEPRTHRYAIPDTLSFMLELKIKQRIRDVFMADGTHTVRVYRDIPREERKPGMPTRIIVEEEVPGRAVFDGAEYGRWYSFHQDSPEVAEAICKSLLTPIGDAPPVDIILQDATEEEVGGALGFFWMNMLDKLRKRSESEENSAQKGPGRKKQARAVR